jgi:hypothetical protein
VSRSMHRRASHALSAERHTIDLATRVDTHVLATRLALRHSIFVLYIRSCIDPHLSQSASVLISCSVD